MRDDDERVGVVALARIDNPPNASDGSALTTNRVMSPFFTPSTIVPASPSTASGAQPVTRLRPVSGSSSGGGDACAALMTDENP